MRLKSFFPYLLIAALLSAFGILMDDAVIPGKGSWNLLELRTIDLRFLLKRKPATDAAKEIVLIAIDEESYEKFKQPLILYHTYIAETIKFLVDSGVRVIGLDLELPNIPLVGRIPEYDQVYTMSFMYARARGVDVVIGYSNNELPPFASYIVAAGGRDTVGSLILTDDADSYVRRQELFGVDAKGRKYESFAFKVAKRFTGGRLSSSGQTILIDYTLGKVPIRDFFGVYGLINSRAQGNLFKDKVVIIGTALDFEDKHPTPLDSFYFGRNRRLTDGVRIQAAILNTLLSGSIFREPGFLAGSLYIAACAIVTVLLCYRRRPVSAALICIAEAGSLFAGSVYAFDQLYLIRLSPLLLTIMLCFGSTTVFHYYREERKKIIIRKRFASYVPENVIDRIVDMGIEKLTQGERKKVALLFCDIRGFTTFSESNKNDPQRIVRFLNEYHNEMTDTLLSHGGTVSQLTGDGIFAFFGAPVEMMKPVLGALKAALEMREKIMALRPRWQEHGMPDLRIGIGIHFGDA
ncbi:MAG TPA: adenylate/guanylate cyclase domain-containing protein, partial [Dissulfurispiraceae bacterium]|nr:adenylate/guanylate cyclase domain-containing protein [Dissulfurispiraceae bacterium]